MNCGKIGLGWDRAGEGRFTAGCKGSFAGIARCNRRMLTIKKQSNGEYISDPVAMRVIFAFAYLNLF